MRRKRVRVWIAGVARRGFEIKEEVQVLDKNLFEWQPYVSKSVFCDVAQSLRYPPRPLRLCGIKISLKFHRRDAEDAEVAQRRSQTSLIETTSLP